MNKEIKVKQGAGLRGHYHAEVHEAITVFKNPIKSLAVKVINWFLARDIRIFENYLERCTKGRLLRTYDYDNLIPSVGLAAFAAQMSGQNSTDIGDNLYIAVGSNATAPASGDTQLGTETARKAVPSKVFSGAVATLAAFFAAGEATGTHREFGLFGNGNAATASATANTGTLFSHVATNTTVGATETLTITFELTFS